MSDVTGRVHMVSLSAALAGTEDDPTQIFDALESRAHRLYSDASAIEIATGSGRPGASHGHHRPPEQGGREIRRALTRGNHGTSLGPTRRAPPFCETAFTQLRAIADH
jgi:hypothetical protein